MSDIFTVRIDCGNSAFDDGARDSELARILRGIADKLEQRGASGFFETVRDINGNDVGRFAVKPAEYFEVTK